MPKLVHETLILGAAKPRKNYMSGQAVGLAKQQTNKVFGLRAGSYKEASLHLTARTSAERPSSDQPAAKPWQLRQRLG